VGDETKARGLASQGRDLHQSKARQPTSVSPAGSSWRCIDPRFGSAADVAPSRRKEEPSPYVADRPLAHAQVPMRQSSVTFRSAVVKVAPGWVTCLPLSLKVMVAGETR
jgi:hypothetical protein